MIYQIPDSAYTGTSGRYPVSHPSAARMELTSPRSSTNLPKTHPTWSTCRTPMVMERVSHRSSPSFDIHSYFLGGSSVIQVTQPGSSTCELSGSSNHTTQTFSFNASGTAAQCSDNFHLDWDYSQDQAPYNVSIVPLDQSFRSFSVRMSSRAEGSSNWVVNLQAGIKFTVMFK